VNRESPWARISLGIIVSIVAVALVLMRVDLGDVAEAFRSADYWWLLIAIAASFLTVPIRAQRWRLICKPVPLTFTRAFGILSVGAALTSLLPLRLGDFARAYLVGEMERRSKVWALTTIVFERILDIIALLIITGLLLPFVSLPDWAIASARVSAVLAVVAVSVICVLWFWRSAIERRIGPLASRFSRGPVERVRSLARHLVEGLAILSRPSQLLGAAFWTAALWLTTGAVLWSTLMAFDVSSSPTIAMLLVVVSAATVAVPLSPGAVGVYHAAIIETVIVVTSASTSTATSVAITAHILLFAPPIICGFACFWLVPGIADRLLHLRRERVDPTRSKVISSGTLPPG
jgi:uncharacterized protein (TIRG00374 family)